MFHIAISRETRKKSDTIKTDFAVSHLFFKTVPVKQKINFSWPKHYYDSAVLLFLAYSSVGLFNNVSCISRPYDCFNKCDFPV